MAVRKDGLMFAVVILILMIVGWYWYIKMYPRPNEVSPQVVETVITPTVPAVGEVLIRQNTFVPETMTIKVGETVTWVNQESYLHDVVSDDGTFVSPKMATGQRYSFTFTKEGTYTYICSIHPFMRATIIVTK
ncbi:MAG: Blue (Type 1) copper domain protein [Candidatus Collierbacteria bacterium GW2011_GWA1_42_60]|uniref:Blue (Type 1) copper domain protein n=1 Tax=Candidatus Collierbacteria bacterium GW2011_GWA2_42_17 TaxID=1618378 RepID=A0A0G1B9Y5_9BACT|nr:MAG: Blue (Type 1) copper domain protein [Candidatus Collierbacteria bacterium GW2011_GWB2_42_12]KKS43126.1 MAG: Blue (Type 1) copper domain protein [Candidatus Collierbacteria bacterium GW2011_GWA2_42_17]KKS62519.1 MAG: Blue (Type 1) copper domain protein [Candidatus Collierbacteria bacterium GW2011_GWD2_42_50]KKS62728.1 MAG: Blue (Type 1) copper domain protein [Candidatus Collierbacteria bacterium GW2011_GWF1_42_50]KKS63115.1 MAG: Blue (Type 1) copper domain protein [Candidatus Collierbact